MAVPNDIRQINRRQILLSSLKLGATTRSALARATGLSQPTAGKIVDELEAEGVLQSYTPAEAAVLRPGRPGQTLRLDDSSPRFLAIQLGVMNTRLATLSVAPPTDDDWAATIRTPTSLGKWLLAVKAAAGPLLTGKPAAILVSVPGVLDESTGKSLLSPNIRWLEGQNIGASLEDAFGLPVHAVQEIRCLALGQRAVVPEGESFLLVDFGHGIGSAAMLRGELLHGQLPLTGEIGHTPAPGHHLPCGCGGRGCVETVVGRQHMLQALGFDESSPGDAEDAFAEIPDKLPKAFREALEIAGLAIAGSLNMLGLAHVVVTGYASTLPEHAFDVLRQQIQTAAVAGRFGEVKTVQARRHRLAGLAIVGIDRVLAPSPTSRFG